MKKMLLHFHGSILQLPLKIFVTRHSKICGKRVITLQEDRSLGQIFLCILVCTITLYFSVDFLVVYGIYPVESLMHVLHTKVDIFIAVTFLLP